MVSVLSADNYAVETWKPMTLSEKQMFSTKTMTRKMAFWHLNGSILKLRILAGGL